jgi:hypothetical protein
VSEFCPCAAIGVFRLWPPAVLCGMAANGGPGELSVAGEALAFPGRKMRSDKRKDKGMAEKPSRAGREELLEEFLDHMAAQRHALTLAEARAAGSMLAEGFDFGEVAAFFQTSSWAAFYRECVRKHHVPESESALAALRESFELKRSPKAASQSVIDDLRASPSVNARGERSPVAERVARELQTQGREALRWQHWPEWMRALVRRREGSGDKPALS